MGVAGLALVCWVVGPTSVAVAVALMALVAAVAYLGAALPRVTLGDDALVVTGLGRAEAARSSVSDVRIDTQRGNGHIQLVVDGEVRALPLGPTAFPYYRADTGLDRIANSIRTWSAAVR